MAKLWRGSAAEGVHSLWSSVRTELVIAQPHGAAGHLRSLTVAVLRKSRASISFLTGLLNGGLAEVQL